MASPDRPTGQITFLFTDIEGSTRLVESLGTAAWGPVLARHRGIIRAALARHGGHEVGTEGDGFFAVFADPLAAVRAAADAQRGLAGEPWPSGAAVRVRMGIHAGIGELDPDGGYVGHDVHRAARVAAAGHGGQVLLSEPATDAIAGQVPDDLGIRPLGAHRLKDLQPEQIAQLLVPGLPADYPPIRSLDARPNNLPTQLTSFVGRERELTETSALVERSRLLTLTGPGGTGKTRLSLQLAAGVADRFQDGLWWVPLAAVRDPLLIVPTVIRIVGAGENVDRAPIDQLVDALAGRRVLIVLDNLEQLPGASPIIANVLKALPRLHILATSRSPLRISGEQEYPLTGLPAPIAMKRLGLMERERLTASQRRQDAAGLGGYEAVILFVTRGAAVRPGFELTDGNAPDVAAIVARLDGIPLALELAAARLRYLTPAAIRERLEQRLDLPGAGAMDVPERQRTLRGAIEWSHDLLDERHRRLLDRLAVFSGGFDLDCAETVAGRSEDPGMDLLDGLATLADQSLVRTGDADGEPRFSLLEPIREFGLEQLEESGEAERLRERHAGAYLALAARLEPLLAGDDQRRWLDKLELEHDNIRAALDWSEGAEKPEIALALAAHSWRFWQKRAICGRRAGASTGCLRSRGPRPRRRCAPMRWRRPGVSRTGMATSRVRGRHTRRRSRSGAPPDPPRTSPTRCTTSRSASPSAAARPPRTAATPSRSSTRRWTCTVAPAMRGAPQTPCGGSGSTTTSSTRTPRRSSRSRKRFASIARSVTGPRRRGRCASSARRCSSSATSSGLAGFCSTPCACSIRRATWRGSR